MADNLRTQLEEAVEMSRKIGGRKGLFFSIKELETILSALEAVEWRPIETAPRDGTEFLSYGGPDNLAGKAQPTRWLSPGPYSTENGKNAEGMRRYQWPDGFYWAGYDGFVGPVHPTHWRPLGPTPQTTPENPHD